MRIRNTTGGLILIGDLPNTQGGSGLPVPAGVDVLIYNEDAEKSRQLGSFLTSGAIANMGSEEPSTGSPEAAVQPALLGPFQVNVTNAPVLGKVLVATSAISAQWEATSGTIALIDSETPMGVIDGSNKIFTLANIPVGGSLHLYLNGLRQSPAIDYTIVSQTITFVNAPTVPGKLLADYRL